MSWDWGNSESPEIYHDPETRKNSITYRTNLARLAETLLAEGKKDKAKKIIDLAMEKMPVDYYGYYTLLEPYATGYYRLGEKEKARKLLDGLIKKYQEELNYYKGLAPDEQNEMAMEVIGAIERYRSLLWIMKDENDPGYYEKARRTFNTYNAYFKDFKRDNE
jgi:tetratricopeptide (TPR) repeat protein